MSEKGTIIYVGGFEMPDKNAAAHRVLNNGKIFKELGYNVVYLGISHDKKTVTKEEIFGMDSWSMPYPKGTLNWLKYLSSIEILKDIASKYDDVKAIIFYNYQAVAFKKALRLCKSNNWISIADATEWYVAKRGSFIFRTIKNADSNYRMKKLHKKVDGVIAISGYLYDYYKDSVPTIEIPPLVDKSEEKWQVQATKEQDMLKLVYAGSGSAQKEMLDTIVAATEEFSKENNVQLNVIGITKEDYRRMYQTEKPIADCVKFLGRIDNKKVIAILKSSDYSVIIRENSKLVMAGFPTKLVESISAGVPVIVNKFSNITDYMDENSGIIIDDKSDLLGALSEAKIKKQKPDADAFDYKTRIQKISSFMETISK